MIKKKLLILSFFFLFIGSTNAETIILNSGESMEGRVIERTDEYIVINLHGDLSQHKIVDIEKIIYLNETDTSSHRTRQETFQVIHEEPTKYQSNQNKKYKNIAKPEMIPQKKSIQLTPKIYLTTFLPAYIIFLAFLGFIIHQILKIFKITAFAWTFLATHLNLLIISTMLLRYFLLPRTKGLGMLMIPFYWALLMPCDFPITLIAIFSPEGIFIPFLFLGIFGSLQWFLIGRLVDYITSSKNRSQ
ncbi:MAG: hypothetical protein GY858_04910 [Candidatus Omnitrophica bacterium]|nr:hypothetical protein [Candidatus Omnitrophota bacterium]